MSSGAGSSSKRRASQSPGASRATKRQSASTLEEGEVTQPASTLPPLPSSVPPKPKVPFPFKTNKTKEAPKNIHLEHSEKSTTANGILPRDDNNRMRESDRKRGLPAKPPGDHWEPPSRYESSSSRNRHRDPYYKPHSPKSPHSPRRSRSPSPALSSRSLHRLPPRGHSRSRSPSRRDSRRDDYRDRDRDRDRWTQRSWSRDRTRDRSRDSRDNRGRGDRERRSRHDDEDGWSESDRHYRPRGSETSSRRANDERAWTRRDDDTDRNRRRRQEDDYDRGYAKPRSYRHVSSQPSNGPTTPPRPQPPISPSGPMTPEQRPQPARQPVADAGTPPPPAVSPPPPPPPDSRVNVSISKRGPSPVRKFGAGLPMKPGFLPDKPMLLQPKPSNRAEIPPPKEKERPVKKREPSRRTRKQDQEAYGRVFQGCGLQSDYEVTTKLGEGTFGEVHKAVHRHTGQMTALKRILMHNEKEGMPVTALREIKILKALKHPCIVEILDMFVVRSTETDPLSVYMVFPYMDHDLAGLLENERVKLQPSHIKLYMKQLLEGTEYMHQNHILHRDMKAANLLISNSGSLKIADFGLARSFDPNATRGGSDPRSGKERKYTNCVVTRWYRPPELLLGARQYGGEVDMWGIGCVLGEMFNRRPILPGTSDLDQLEKIWYLCGTPNQHSWPNHDTLPGCEGVKRFATHGRRVKQHFESTGIETCDLLDKLLTCNPRERYTASQALDHPYFWTDPLPADPKSLPSYEASHEYDRRGQRHHAPAAPQGPPPPSSMPPPAYNSRNGPPPGHFHGGGPSHFHRPGPPPHQNHPGGGRGPPGHGPNNFRPGYPPSHGPPSGHPPPGYHGPRGGGGKRPPNNTSRPPSGLPPRPSLPARPSMPQGGPSASAGGNSHHGSRAGSDAGSSGLPYG